MTPAEVLRTEKLSKWYGNILGISEISLVLTPGVYGLLGPNGAGKTTFLKIISGQLRPNLGTVRIFNQPVFNNPDLFKKVGFCPEIDAYYQDITGRRFLLFMARLHSFSPVKAAEETDRVLQTVGLTEAGDKLISAYSLGMRQRIRIAASIIHQPDLLLLDEPLRGIDPLWRARIIDLVEEYRKDGKTVIVSSHILPEIESMTNHITLIHQGKVFAHGDIQQIRSLIDTHPHQISISCKNPRSLAQRLVSSPSIQSLEIPKDRDTVVFRTNRRDIFFDLLMAELARSEYQVTEIYSPDDNLQSVFDYLIGD
jgi:ABC-2 type transport system ATP-binding protein